MPEKTRNVKDFTRPKDPGHRFQGMHSTGKEGSEQSPRLMQNFIKPDMKAAGARAKKAGAKRGTGGARPKGPGPQHGPGKTTVTRGKKTR